MERTAAEPDHYAALGVTPDATVEEVRAAFRARALLLHPKQHVNAPLEVRTEAERLFTELLDAQQTLIDEAKRQAYDQRRSSASSSQARTAASKESLTREFDEFFQAHRSSPPLRQEVPHVPPPRVSPPSPSPYVPPPPRLNSASQEIRDQAARSMLIYGAIAVVALFVSLATYSSAEDGGTYVVWWGPVLFGGFRFFQALIKYNSASD